MKLRMPAFPDRLRSEIDKLTAMADVSALAGDAGKLSSRYRHESGCGKRLLTEEREALAYAAVRMPATFGAVAKALDYALDAVDFVPKTVLDIGAGTGAAGWAVESLINLDSLVCLEREAVMLRLGQKLMRNSGIPVLENAVWRQADLTGGALAEEADLVLASYVLNELNAAERNKAVEKLWRAAEKMLLVIEPGTPQGYRNLLQVRALLTGAGAFVAAPCPHDGVCPLAAGDWCHFSCRVARSKLHRRLKNAAMGYEDEKFSYMAFVRQVPAQRTARIIRPPVAGKAGIELTLCTTGGIVRKVVKKGSPEYAEIRKKEWGRTDGMSAPAR